MDALRGTYIVQDDTIFEIIAVDKVYDSAGDARTSLLARSGKQLSSFYYDDFHDGVFQIYNDPSAAGEAAKKYAEEVAAAEAAALCPKCGGHTVAGPADAMSTAQCPNCNMFHAVPWGTK